MGPSYNKLVQKRPNVKAAVSGVPSKDCTESGVACRSLLDANYACPQTLPAPQSGADLLLTELLAEFFSWANKSLPSEMNEYSLSIETGCVEKRPPKCGATPLMLTVPLTHDDNAARCLRRD